MSTNTSFHEEEADASKSTDCTNFIPQFYRPAICMVCYRSIAEHFDEWTFIPGDLEQDSPAKYVNQETGETVFAKTKYQVRKRECSTDRRPSHLTEDGPSQSRSTQGGQSFASESSQPGDGIGKQKSTIETPVEDECVKEGKVDESNREKDPVAVANVPAVATQQPQKAASPRKIEQKSISVTSAKVQGEPIKPTMYTPEKVQSVTLSSTPVSPVYSIEPHATHSVSKGSVGVDKMDQEGFTAVQPVVSPVKISSVKANNASVSQSQVEGNDICTDSGRSLSKDSDWSLSSQTGHSTFSYEEGKKTAIEFRTARSSLSTGHEHCYCNHPKPPLPREGRPSGHQSGKEYHGKYASKISSSKSTRGSLTTQQSPQVEDIDEDVDIPDAEEDEDFANMDDLAATQYDSSSMGQKGSHGSSRFDAFPVDDPAFVDLAQLKREFPSIEIARVWQHLPSFLQTAWQLKDIAEIKESERDSRAGATSFRDDSIHIPANSPSRVVCGLLIMAGNYLFFVQPNCLHPSYGILQWICPISSISSVHIQLAKDSSSLGRASQYMDLSPNMGVRDIKVSTWAEYLAANGLPNAWDDIVAKGGGSSVTRQKRPSIFARALGKQDTKVPSTFLQHSPAARPQETVVASLLTSYKDSNQLPEYVIRTTSLALSNDTGAVMQGIMEKCPTEEHHLVRTARASSEHYQKQKRSSLSTVKNWRAFQGSAWKKRFFVLRNGQLEYHNLPKDSSTYTYGRSVPPSSEMKGSITLDGWTEVFFLNQSEDEWSINNVEADDLRSTVFGLRTATSHHLFRVSDPDTAKTWVRRILATSHLACYQNEFPQSVIFESPESARGFFQPLQTSSVIDDIQSEIPPRAPDTDNDRNLAESLSEMWKAEESVQDPTLESIAQVISEENTLAAEVSGNNETPLWEYLTGESDTEGPYNETEMRELFMQGEIDWSTMARCLTYIPSVDYIATNRSADETEAIFLPVEVLFRDGTRSVFDCTGNWISAYK
eukprot:gb/GECG01013481.1/.p1 GENE.gb/GECG01013481.1/~~gb/GECG01013481.1/.p1  ORF type:complete len:998 (+),score=133.79 gb/GECG01013481.1/:1-2994(+)